MSIRDGVDYGPEAWRLSTYITFLIVMAAFPLSLARYSTWLWTEHGYLTLCAMLAWISLGGWVVVRHFSAEKQASDQLGRELNSISRGLPPPAVAGRPQWLVAWGWLNAVAIALVMITMMRIAASLA